ncbi:hypothetical protein CRG98_007844 [Punica granatum]|uniref:Uncharacterized protein n=1 Tax=Punica granatum TaxID=22663 RepID=A0A2I0KTC2_PUNGR|nr:hypothetical protein CRG98_007844 [Punica granatum]
MAGARLPLLEKRWQVEPQPLAGIQGPPQGAGFVQPHAPLGLAVKAQASVLGRGIIVSVQGPNAPLSSIGFSPIGEGYA